MLFFRRPVKITIKDQNLTFEAKTGTNLYEALVEEKVIPQTLCRGNGQCGKCKVKIIGKNIAKPNKKEQLVLAKINLESGYRLACQTVIKGDMIVDTSEITMNNIPDDVFLKPIPKEIKKEEQPEEKKETAQPQEISYATEKTSQASEQTPTEEQEKPKPEAEPQINYEHIKKKNDAKESYEVKDGLLLVYQKTQIRYFLYSSIIDGIGQEDTIQNPEDLNPYIENGMLSDYVHDVLRIRDVDRVIVMSDEPSYEGELLFDAASYTPFDIGSMPCELIRPLPSTGDLSLFYRLISIKGKKKLMFSLDKLSHTYYFAENGVTKIPSKLTGLQDNMYEIAIPKDNPIAEVSNDLRTIKGVKPYDAPDSMTMPVLLKIAAAMHKIGITDSAYVIGNRSDLTGHIPLEYVVKVTAVNNEQAFFLYRDKDSSLLITQSMLSKLFTIKRYMHNVIECVEQQLGKIDSIVITTPSVSPDIIDSITELAFIPKRYENSITHSCVDSAVTAVKLFQEPNVRSYIHKHYGGFFSAE